MENIDAAKGISQQSYGGVNLQRTGALCACCAAVASGIRTRERVAANESKTGRWLMQWVRRSVRCTAMRFHSGIAAGVRRVQNARGQACGIAAVCGWGGRVRAQRQSGSDSRGARVSGGCVRRRVRRARGRVGSG